MHKLSWNHSFCFVVVVFCFCCCLNFDLTVDIESGIHFKKQFTLELWFSTSVVFDVKN